MLDSSVPKTYQAKVLSRYITGGRKGHSYHLEIGPWGPSKREDRLWITKSKYAQYGNPVKVALRNGRFGIPWFEVFQCCISNVTLACRRATGEELGVLVDLCDLDWKSYRRLFRCQGTTMKLFPKTTDQWFRLSALAIMAVSLFVYGIRSIRNLQYRLLYHPSSSMPVEDVLRAANMKPWLSTGADYRGLVAIDKPASCKGAVIVFHGNGGTAADRVYYLNALGALGYRVVLAEYPRYGGRKGELGEKAYVDDAKESTRLAFEEFGGPIFLLGESMGCGIAAAVAAETPVRIDGIILITPWDTLASIAKERFPFLPVRLFLRDEYDSIKNLNSFKGRIAVVGAELDEVLPVAHAGRLYDSLPTAAKRMWTLKEAGHNDWYRFIGKGWWEEVMDFISC